MTKARNPYHDAEAALLAVLWAGWPQGEAIRRDLPAAMFLDHNHRALFVELCRRCEAGETFDRTGIAKRLMDAGSDIDLGVIERTMAMEASPTAVHEYIDLVIRANQNYLWTRAARKIREEEGADLAAIAADLSERLKAVESYAAPILHSVSVGEVLDEIFQPQLPTIPTGSATLDTMFGGSGMSRQQLSLLLAAPGTGKSSLMASIAHYVAHSGKGSVLYVSKEMRLRAIMFRIWASMTNIPLTTINNIDSKISAQAEYDEMITIGEEADPPERMTTEEKRLMERFEATARSVDYSRYNLRFLSIDRLDKITVETIAREVRAINHQAKQRNQRIALVLVDYLQIVDKAEDEQQKGQNDAQALGKLAQDLHTTALKEDVHILAASSMNRGSSSDKMSRASGSQGIVFAAENVYFMDGYFKLPFEKKELEDAYNGCTVLEIEVAKSRGGEPGRHHFLKFRRAVQQISDIPRDEVNDLRNTIANLKKESAPTHAR